MWILSSHLCRRYSLAATARQQPAVFSFLYLKKLKFQKYIFVLENFKNILWSPYWRATGLKWNFFSSNLQRSPWRKKKRGPVATGPCRPSLRRPTRRPGLQAPGGRSPIPRATGSAHPYIRPPPSFPPHLTSKNPKKIQNKERGEEKGSGEALPNSALVIYR